jgi:hypothetical protein
MSDATERYEQIAKELSSRPGVKQAKMFGMPGLKLGKTAFAGLFGDDMVFKLGAGTDAHKRAMKLKGAEIWDPSGRDRPFKDWVRVPATSASQWGLLADYAFERALRQG